MSATTYATNSSRPIGQSRAIEFAVTAWCGFASLMVPTLGD